jgi:hypothetical protein
MASAIGWDLASHAASDVVGLVAAAGVAVLTASGGLMEARTAADVVAVGGGVGVVGVVVVVVGVVGGVVVVVVVLVAGDADVDQYSKGITARTASMTAARVTLEAQR